MYASECIAHQKAEIKFETVNGYPALQIESDFGLVNFTMSHAQLEDLLEKGEWWLTKNDLPDCAECGHNKPEYTPTDRGAIPNRYHCEIDETPEECGK